MDDLIQLLPIRRLNHKSILVGVILFTVQALLVFIWAYASAPLSVSPAGAVALALLYRLGLGYWPAILGGSILGMSLAGVAPLSLVAASLSYTLQALIGAQLLKKFEFNIMLSRLHDSAVLVSVLVGTAFIFPTVILALDGILRTHILVDESFAQGLTWSKALIAALFSNLIYTPFILRWSVAPHLRSFREYVEIFFTLGAASTISWFLFWTDTTSIIGISLAYILLIPLLWITLRLGPRMIATALAVCASIALASFLNQSYIYGLPVINLQELFQTELFFVMLATMFLIVVGMEEERKEKTKELEAHVSGLTTEIKVLSDDDRLKNEFIATLAHELRNPLAPVVSTLELLQMRNELSRESLQLVKRVEHQIETVKRLLDDLLDVSRITQKKFKLKKEACMLYELIAHCESNADHIMRSFNHRLEILLPKQDVPLYVDPTRFEQIVTNLLYNAAKYTERGGHIKLQCEVKNRKLIVRLRDNGIGIDPEHLEQIFLPFRQMRTKQHTGTGLGIGLAITKQLVEMHEGTITAKSEGLGKGSEFTVILPILDRRQSERDRSENPEVSTKMQRVILIVDDNEEAAKALARLLEFRGHRIYVAHSGKEAIENTRLFKPEIILLDIGLPDMSGHDVARRLRESGVHAKLIAVTGYGQEDDRISSEEAGFDHHLVKPVSLQEVEKHL